MLIEGRHIYTVEDLADMVLDEARKLSGEAPVRLNHVREVADRLGIEDLSSLVIPVSEGQRLGLKDVIPGLWYEQNAKHLFQPRKRKRAA